MKRILFFVLFFSGLSLAQNVRYDAPFPSISSQTSTPFLVANVPPNSPVLAVCHSPANALPCTNYATTYTSAGTSCPNGAQDTPQPQPSSCQATGDGQGNIGFWAPAGTYAYTVCIGANCYGPYTVTLGSTAGGGFTPAGDLSGSSTTQEVVGLLNNALPALSSGCLNWSGSVWNFTGCSGGGGGTPSAPTNSLQFNSSGSFGGASSTSFNATTGQVDLNNQTNIHYATTAYNWSQLPSGTLTANVQATVTLTPCPLGIDGRDSIGEIYVSGVGTPEPVQMQGGGSCTPGGASGTIKFTPLNNHSAGYTLGSASSGIYEALAASANKTGTGGSANAHLVLAPAGTSAATGFLVQAYKVYGTIYMPLNNVTIDASGTVFDCSTRDYCMAATSFGPLKLIGGRFASELDTPGWGISSTQCTAGVVTITTVLNHGIQVGDTVDVQRTDGSQYWGGSVSWQTKVTSVTANTVSYPASNCGGGIALQTTPGFINIVNAPILIANQADELDTFSMDKPGGSGSPIPGHFNNGIVALNDQAFKVNGFLSGVLSKQPGLFTTCSPTNDATHSGYCGQLFYFPGPGTQNATIARLDGIDLSPTCSGNGITAFSGNTISVNGGVAQGYPQYGITTGNRRGGLSNTVLTSFYEESDLCSNPDNPAGVASSMGVYNYNGGLQYTGGEGPQGTVPTFTTGGATTYYYWLIATDSVLGDSAPLFFGTAAPTGTSVSGFFPRVAPTNVVTYSVIRTTDASNAPQTAACQGGSTAACGTIFTAMAQCAGLSCAFTDNVSLNTTAVTTTELPAYTPDAMYWPGAAIVTGGNGQVTWTGNGNFTGLVNLSGRYFPSGFTSRFTGSAIGAWIQSLGGTVTLLDDVNSNTAGLKGRININRFTNVPAGDLITLVDSNPKKTINISTHRPFSDALDTAICQDLGSAALTATGLCFRGGVAISNYVGTTGDGLSWLERLTASTKEFAVNAQFDQPMLALIGCTGCGAFNRTTAFINDTFNRGLSGSLGGNWTMLLGTWAIVQGSAFVHPYADFTATTVEAGTPRAYAYYSATGFNNDQWVQATIVPANNFVGICVRMANSAPLNAYCLFSGSNQTVLQKFVAGTPTALYTNGSNVPNFTVIKLQAQGTTISIYENGIFITSVTDSAVTSGAPGVMGENNVVTTQGLSNFYAGNTGWTATEQINTNSLISTTYGTTTNCAAKGTAANPSLVACGSAASGTFSCDPAATGATCVISTTAVTANSDIHVTSTSATATRIGGGITCNTTADAPTGPRVSALSAGTSFTINLGTVAVNPACFFYEIQN